MRDVASSVQSQATVHLTCGQAVVQVLSGWTGCSDTNKCWIMMIDILKILHKQLKEHFDDLTQAAQGTF